MTKRKRHAYESEPRCIGRFSSESLAKAIRAIVEAADGFSKRFTKAFDEMHASLVKWFEVKWFEDNDLPALPVEARGGEKAND